MTKAPTIYSQNIFFTTFRLQAPQPHVKSSTRQSGLPDFRLANIISDVDAIQIAREAAFELVHSGPLLD